MSVAFRRESGDEHLERKFELPIPVGPNLVTARGMKRIADLEAQLDAAANEAARAIINRDLRYWHTRQITAQDTVLPAPAWNKVEIGVRARIRLNGASRTIAIVGDGEADPADGLISFKAPLSQAMLGAEVGEMHPFGGAAEALEILAVCVTEGALADERT